MKNNIDWEQYLNIGQRKIIMSARVTRTSMLSKVTRTLELPQYTPEEFERRMNAYNNGLLIQDAFPEISDSAREFIKNGITEEEWDQYMSVGDDITTYSLR
jgi:hypothetical protein